MSALDRTIECRFHTTKQDYVVMNHAQMHMPRKFNRIMVVRMTVFLVLVALGIWGAIKIAGDPPLEVLPYMAGSAVVVGVFIYFFFDKFARFYGKLMAALYYKSFRVDKNEHVLTFSNEGLASKSEKYDGQSRWSAFHAIMRADAHFVIWINPIQAYIAPFRALTSQDVEEIWAFMKTLPVAKRVKVPA